MNSVYVTAVAGCMNVRMSWPLGMVSIRDGSDSITVRQIIILGNQLCQSLC